MKRIQFILFDNESYNNKNKAVSFSKEEDKMRNNSVCNKNGVLI